MFPVNQEKNESCLLNQIRIAQHVRHVPTSV